MTSASRKGARLSFVSSLWPHYTSLTHTHTRTQCVRAVSASHDIDSRAFLGKRLSGKLKEGGRPGERQSRRWMDSLSRGAALLFGQGACARARVRVCYTACNYVLGGAGLGALVAGPRTNEPSAKREQARGFARHSVSAR